MARIDNIYCSWNQYKEFRKWLKDNRENCIKETKMDPFTNGFMLVEKESAFSGQLSSNFHTRIDAWLWNNCPLEFIKKRLAEQYGEYPF
jgi:hypothetical protein